MSKAPVLDPFKPQDTEAGTAPNGTSPPVCKPEVMTITPEIAQEWASLNTRNRNVRYAKVAQMARDMKTGKWALNGESVKIATDGTILDGQHRLYACMQAEVPFDTVVIRGLPAEVQDTIDTGMARRMADQLAIRGEANAFTTAAVARWALRWLRGLRTGGGSDSEPTHGEMLALIEADPRIREAAAWAENAKRQFKSVNASTWGMAWLLFHGSDHLAAEVFLDKVVTGIDVGEGHPALAFRNRIWKAREAGERLNQHEQLGYLIVAWNAFKEDRKVIKLQAPKGGKFTPKNFPEPK